jgi:A/G-specific adenine glycosylase
VKVAVKIAGRRASTGGRNKTGDGKVVPGPLDAPGIARALLRWYGRARRDLPWRRCRDPYRVWVSEIMLQQTQVERVKDFFVRFMERFPTVASLAAAREDEVLKLWEGLGYYRRARQLHAAAGRIVAAHAGSLPRSVPELRRLPGIGRYTAGAIASIAMDLPEPIVEANSRRVIARLACHAGRLDRPGDDEPIWEIARRLVPKKNPGRFNQALMDLGSLVCTPQRPMCGSCPVAALCAARQAGRVADIPLKAARRAVQDIRETAVVVRRGPRFLVVQRGPGEWWEGLWDFPRVPGAARGARRGIERSDLLGGLACGAIERLGAIRHTVTHHRIELDVVACTAGRSGRSAPDRAWVTPARMAALAMTAPGRRIARLIGPCMAKTSGR